MKVYFTINENILTEQSVLVRNIWKLLISRSVMTSAQLPKMMEVPMSIVKAIRFYLIPSASQNVDAVNHNLCLISLFYL